MEKTNMENVRQVLDIPEIAVSGEQVEQLKLKSLESVIGLDAVDLTVLGAVLLWAHALLFLYHQEAF
jgi:hypothetical protein